MGGRIQLLARRRFLPFFLCQFFGALNDNLFRSALVTLLIFGALSRSADNSEFLAQIALGFFMAPFILFSAVAGDLADKVDKIKLIRVIKAAEIAVMALAAVGLILQSAILLLLALTLTGAQSAFFGPVKYSLLPRLLSREELLAGNGYFAASTFIAILLGVIWGANLGGGDAQNPSLIFGVIAVAVCGFLAAMRVPSPANPVASSSPMIWNLRRAAMAAIGKCRERPQVFRCVLAICWFWLLGAAMITELPLLVRDGIGGDRGVFRAMLALLCVGVGFGAMLSVVVLRGKISVGRCASALFIAGIFLLDFAFVGGGFSSGEELKNLSAVSRENNFTRLLVDFFIAAAAAGFFVAPLYAMVQAESPPESCSRVIAANNILNAFFVIAVALGAAVLHLAGFSAAAVFGFVGALTLAAAALCHWKLKCSVNY